MFIIIVYIVVKLLWLSLEEKYIVDEDLRFDYW